jgi:hypothetical protein
MDKLIQWVSSHPELFWTILAAVAGGVWAVFTYFHGKSSGGDKPGGVSQSTISIGGDAHLGSGDFIKTVNQSKDNK